MKEKLAFTSFVISVIFPGWMDCTIVAKRSEHIVTNLKKNNRWNSALKKLKQCLVFPTSFTYTQGLLAMFLDANSYHVDIDMLLHEKRSDLTNSIMSVTIAIGTSEI